MSRPTDRFRFHLPGQPTRRPNLTVVVAAALLASASAVPLADAQITATAPAGPAPTTAPSPAAPAPGAPAAPAGAAADDYAARYAILADKNIFVRNRPPTRSITARGSEQPRRAEEAFLLTGIAMQEGRNVAFIENTATGATQRVLSGDPVAGGKVITIAFDALEFEANGRTTRIPIGRNLLGDRFSPGTNGGGAGAGSATAPAGANGAAPAAPLPGDPNLSLEERMKLRRQQSGGTPPAGPAQ